LSLSTQQANEASNVHARSSGARLPLPRPHLVPAAEKRPSDVAVMEISTAADVADTAADASLVGPVARFIPRSRWGIGAATKRAFDIVGALALGVVFAPLMAVIVIMTRREGGAALYKHRRVGLNGQMFGCLKFRTMIPNADQVLRELLEKDPDLKAEWVRDHKLRNDPRVTRLGRFLRRTSLDELPQIWNVLRGEMSLVGPRPVVREELLRYGRSVRVYLSTKPGITGLWQVTGRNDTDYRRRVALDAYYARNQSLWLDMYILSKTTFVVLGGSGAY
jgi:Undecaprenyl-phosphate galactose phosphotransferase WbaP